MLLADLKDALPLGKEEIQSLIPHRPPFLFVDKVLSIDHDNTTLVAEHKILEDSVFFQGHFPKRKIMPGVLIAEGAAQSACILGVFAAAGEDGITADHDASDIIPYLVSISKARFVRRVYPGDTLTYEARLVRSKMKFVVFKVGVRCDGELVASMEITSIFDDGTL